MVYLMRLNFKFRYFPGVGWLHRHCGRSVARAMQSVVCTGYVLGGVKVKIKLNSAQLELELGLSLATIGSGSVANKVFQINVGKY